MLKDVTYKDVAAYTWHYWRRRPKAFAGVFALMGAATIVDTFVPVYTRGIVDALTNHTPGDPVAYGQALGYLARFAALAFAFNVLRFASIELWNWFAVRNMYEILTEAMRKVQRFSTDWHANAFAGGTVRKITRGMWAFDVYGDTLFVGLFPAAIIMSGMTAMLLVQLPLVGAFAAVMIAVYTAVSVHMAVVIGAPLHRASARADTQVGATLADIVTGNATVKSFGAERREDALFEGVATEWRTKSQRAWFTGEACNLVRGLLRMTMMTGMIGLTVWLWQAGRATPGDIALSLTSFFILGGYMRDIGMHIVNVQKSVSEMEDIIGFHLRRDDVRDAEDARPYVRVKNAPGAEVAFENVRFNYNGQDKPLFENLSVRIAPGEKVALVGHSGSGKSTFVKLLQRLYDVDGGRILLDGQNTAVIAQESLRQAVALVPQDPVLFHRSLADNIAYGRPGADMEAIIDAARKAYAHEFITRLPDEYGTLVGERGVKLSGGERQRVAIARAILADAPVLVLDEATSSLDSVSEHYIQRALETLMRGRTTITVAHRLSTVMNADRILVFDRGRIVEQGTHRQLLAKGGLYRTLCEVQSVGLMDDGPLMEGPADENEEAGAAA